MENILRIQYSHRSFCFFSRSVRAGFPFRRVSSPQPAALIGTRDTCASSAGLLNHFFRPRGVEGHANDAQSTPGSALAHHWRASARCCEIQRRPANDAVGDMFVWFAHHWRASARFCDILRRLANDVLGDIFVDFAHHWRAFRAFGIVSAFIF